MQLLPNLQFSCHPAQSVLASHLDPADKLITILTGKVSVYWQQHLERWPGLHNPGPGNGKHNDGNPSIYGFLALILNAD